MSVAKPRQDRLGLALPLALGAFFFFVMIDTSAKWLVQAGLPALQVVFIRYAGHFLACLVVLYPSEGRELFRSNAPKIQVMRALLLVISTSFNFAALQYLPLTITTAIFFATPIVVVLLSIPLLGETVGIRRLVAVLIGFCGVLIVIRPVGEFHFAMLLSLGALVTASSYFVLTRMIAGRDDNPTSQFYSSSIPTLLLAPVALSIWVWPEGGWSWLAAALIGMFGFAGHSCLTVAHRYAEASTLAPSIYVQIIYVTAISWLVFGEPPDDWTILGSTVIIGSGLFIWWRERKKHPVAMTGAPFRN